MRKLLLISFDFFRRGEARASYPLACLRSAVAADHCLRNEWAVDVASIDLMSESAFGRQGLYALLKERAAHSRYDVVAFGDYSWSSRLTRDLMNVIAEWQPEAALIAGGYQVTSTPHTELEHYYPSRLPITFLKGFGEASLVTYLKGFTPGSQLPRIMEERVDCRALPSPWLEGQMPLEPGTAMVRWETKRGCQYSCDYCEFKSASNRPTGPREMMLDEDRLLEELELFRARGVAKVNVLDPLFNIDGTYERLLDPIIGSGLSFTFQTRVERLERQVLLVEAARNNPRIRLEIGVQTLDEELNQLLCRKNQKSKILATLASLKTAGISFETNLIFGIPGQSPLSHIEDIEALMRAGCEKKDIRCFPLRIPRGSRLEARRTELHVAELPALGNDRLVLEADGFDFVDWTRMLLASEADAAYLAVLKTVQQVDPELLRLGKHDRLHYLADTIAWMRALKTRGYVYRVMVMQPDGTARLHGTFDELRFLWPTVPSVSRCWTPGVYFARRWGLALLRQEERERLSPDYVMLRRRWMGLERERPARVLLQEIDVAGAAVVLWVTWSLSWREGLRLIWAMATGGSPPTEAPLPPDRATSP